MIDILIKNGTVFDGLGNPGRKQDIAVNKGKITEVGARINPKTARQVIDAEGKYVAPGFIDIQNHSDSYWTLFDQPWQSSLLSQGITSIIVGNCGSSLAPLISPESVKTIQKWHDLSGVNINWSSFSEFLNVLESKGSGVNVGSMVGHATMRRGLMGDAIREITPSEMRSMDSLLSKALDEGALGLSLGLVYAHEVDTTLAELKELASNLKSRNRYLSVHLRSEGSHILESIDESIEVAKIAEVPLKISHLKIRGKKNWHLLGQVLNRLENAYHSGMDISFDVYPYESSWSVLYIYLPKWAYEGGRSEILRRLSDKTDRRKIIDYLKVADYDYYNMIVAEAQGNPGFIGKSIAQIAANQSVSGEEAMLNIIAAGKTQVVVFDHNLNADHLDAFLTSPLSIIATDGAGYSHSSQNLVHPRCFGAMPRFLRLVSSRKLMKWEEAIRKITSEPARVAGIIDRGTIAKNMAADVVVFNPQTISDAADYNQPYRVSSGVESVLINGKTTYAEGKLIEMNGSVIKR